MSTANRMAIPLGRLVQTPTGPHILLRTSSGTPISSTIPPSIIRQSQSPQNPMRQIIVRSVQPNIVGMSALSFSPFMASIYSYSVLFCCTEVISIELLFRTIIRVISFITSTLSNFCPQMHSFTDSITPFLLKPSSAQ